MPMRRPSRLPQGRRPHDRGRRLRGRGGGFRAAASETHARGVPHARLRVGRRGYRAGSLHPLDEGRARRRARARGVLRRTVTRLCLDQLKSARRTRETYIGPWLPDPVVEEDEADDVTLPLMLVLERLSPLERAAFLLQTCSGWDSTRSRPP